MDDCRQIENLIYTYAELIDAGRLEDVAELFRHGEIAAPGAGEDVTAGYDAVLAMYRDAARIYADTGTPKTRHLTSNIILETDGDQATARSCFTVFQATEELPLQPIILGRYHDGFERVDGNWRFRRREMYVDLIGDCSAHLLYSADRLA